MYGLILFLISHTLNICLSKIIFCIIQKLWQKIPDGICLQKLHFSTSRGLCCHLQNLPPSLKVQLKTVQNLSWHQLKLKKYFIINHLFYHIILSSIGCTSTGCFINGLFHQLVVSSTGCFINWLFHQLVVSSTGCFSNW